MAGWRGSSFCSLARAVRKNAAPRNIASRCVLYDAREQVERSDLRRARTACQSGAKLLQKVAALLGWPASASGCGEFDLDLGAPQVGGRPLFGIPDPLPEEHGIINCQHSCADAKLQGGKQSRRWPGSDRSSRSESAANVGFHQIAERPPPNAKLRFRSIDDGGHSLRGRRRWGHCHRIPEKVFFFLRLLPTARALTAMRLVVHDHPTIKVTRPCTRASSRMPAGP